MPANKMVIIGIDSISMSVLDQMLERGYCPTIKRLIENGCYGLGRSFCPVETGTNWPVLSTGASPMVTGCNMGLHLPGMPLNSTTRGFPSGLCRAEQIWNAARRAGKRSVIFDYPQSKPINCDDVIHVGEDGRPGQGLRALSEMHAWKTEPYDTSRRLKGLQSFVTQIEMQPAQGWANLPCEGCLAAEMPISPGPCSEYSGVSSLWLLLVPEAGKFATATVCGDRDYAKKLADVRVGEWTEPMLHTFQTDQGPVEAFTRGKLFRLSPDGRDVHLYCHQIYKVRGFAHPEPIEDKLLELCGPYYPHGCRQQSINSGACDVWTFHDELDITVEWYRKAMDYVLRNETWDLFMQKWHPPDFAYHFGAFMIDEAHPLFDPARREEGWDFWGKVMNYGDQLVAQAWEIAGDDAIVAVMSDHGGRMVMPGALGHSSPQAALRDAGLIVSNAGGGIDWSRTKAWGSQHYAWVNLKGRDPDGCVEPEDYGSVRREIMDALLAAEDPHSGRRMYNLVCTREDAAMVGVGSDIAGDVFLWSEAPPEPEPVTLDEFRRQHPDIEPGAWEQPNHNSGTHSPDPFMIMAGPGLKKGYRRDQAQWINYFAPTLAHVWGIPVPKDADGGVIWDFVQ